MIQGDLANSGSVGTGAPEAALAGMPLGSPDRILRNSALNLGSQGVAFLSQVIMVFLLARGIGAVGLGKFYTAFTIILIVQMLLEQSVSTVLTCRIAQAAEHWKAKVAEAAGLFVMITLASALVVFGLGVSFTWLWQDESDLPGYAAAAVACAAMQIQRFCGGVFHAFEVFAYENLGKILQGMSCITLLFALLALGWLSVTTALAALAASQVLVALFLIVTLQRHWRCLAFRLNREIMRSWLAQAIPLGLGDVSRGLMAQSGTLVLGLFQPAAIVGIFSLAFRPLGAISWLARSVLQATFPSLARMAVHDPPALNQAVMTSTRLLWIISLPIAISICFCAEPLIIVFAGPEFSDATAPMQMLIWITALSFLSCPFRFLFTALGRSRAYLVLVLGVLAVTVAAQFVLTASFSYVGTCLASVLGELIFALIGIAFFRWHGMVTLEWRTLARGVLAGAGMMALLWPARELAWPLLLLALVVSMIGYAALCLLLGAIHWGEVRQLTKALVGLFRPVSASLPVRS